MPSKTRRITIEIPDYAKTRPIYVFAGRELIYKKELNGPLEKKVVRCNFCGDCCLNTSERWFFGRNDDGSCRFLSPLQTWVDAEGKTQTGRVCAAPGDIVPFTCCTGRGTQGNCVVKFVKVE